MGVLVPCPTKQNSNVVLVPVFMLMWPKEPFTPLCVSGSVSLNRGVYAVTFRTIRSMMLSCAFSLPTPCACTVPRFSKRSSGSLSKSGPMPPRFFTVASALKKSSLATATEPHGGGGGGGEGGGGVDGEGEHAPRLLHSEPYWLTNAALPDHAQRMRSLFASDSPSVPCEVEREAREERRHASREAGGHMEAVAVQAARREGPDCGG